ncbi:MAG: maleylpyruvate isomerase family mycothiol-dependent enzyme, partial [Chloroflexi bacterium]|nr:maleylpyruvate isomerase family mycothiol-dependent enzyme [Chloroflexota bacterium]
MASPPTKAQFKQALFEERRAIADLVDDLTPEQWACPSGCEGWGVGDVTAHLLVADRLTWDPLVGLLKLQTPIKSIYELQKRDAALGPKHLAEKLRSNSLPLMFRFGGGFGSRINFAEHLLHG